MNKINALIKINAVNLYFINVFTNRIQIKINAFNEKALIILIK